MIGDLRNSKLDEAMVNHAKILHFAFNLKVHEKEFLMLHDVSVSERSTSSQIHSPRCMGALYKFKKLNFAYLRDCQLHKSIRSEV